MISGDFVALMD